MNAVVDDPSIFMPATDAACALPSRQNRFQITKRNKHNKHNQRKHRKANRSRRYRR